VTPGVRPGPFNGGFSFAGGPGIDPRDAVPTGFPQPALTNNIEKMISEVLMTYLIGVECAHLKRVLIAKRNFVSGWTELTFFYRTF
jgi:hypothetical protein